MQQEVALRDGIATAAAVDEVGLDIALLLVAEPPCGLVVETLEGIALQERVDQCQADGFGSRLLVVSVDAAAEQRDDVGADGAVGVARLVDDGLYDLLLLTVAEQSLARDEDGFACPLLREAAQAVAAALHLVKEVVVDGVLQR